MNVLQKINQKQEARHYKKYQKTIDQINSKERQYEQFSDAQLKMKTTEFRQQLADGATVDTIKADAFAVVREASRRVLGMRHFDVQLVGGLVLLEGNVAEMPTGEGKTLVASLASYTRALEGKGVHIVTVNEYLAERDRNTIGPIHELLGLSVGLNVPGLDPVKKKKAYDADLTYGTGTEFGFDLLRDNMAYSVRQKVQRDYHYAIIDEIDSVLIDEAKTPLILAGKTAPIANLHKVCARMAKTMKQPEHFTCDDELKVITLTEDGISKIEKIFGIENLFDLEHRSLNHHMMQAIRAHALFELDADYIIDNGLIKLVDMNTGRIMEGRSLGDGLHQALEAKEGLDITDENKTQASITIQNYFRMYPIMSGMTGTAKTEESEFQHIYGMDVVQVPTNNPVIREDKADLVFLKREQKYQRMVEEVSTRHKKGQPVLIGTTSIIQSERVAAYLDNAGLPYHLLNAKSVEQEADLIAAAGQKNQITIATNMAGRGTDIKLGEGVAEVGGLHVLATERHESRRVDNQLKGRSGRQGDPGSTQFIISLEDDLINRYGKEDREQKLEKLTIDKDGRILNKDIGKFIDKVQSYSVGSHSQIREYSLKLDNVVNEQRRVIYKLRNNVLETENVIALLKKQITQVPDEFIEKHCPEDAAPDDWELEVLTRVLNRLLVPAVSLSGNFESQEDVKQALKPVLEEHMERLSRHEDDMKLQETLRSATLSIIDRHWTSHLNEMERMKEGISMRQYQQENPVQLYEKEGLQLFTYMYQELESEFSYQLSSMIKQAERQKADDNANG